MQELTTDLIAGAARRLFQDATGSAVGIASPNPLAPAGAVPQPPGSIAGIPAGPSRATGAGPDPVGIPGSPAEGIAARPFIPAIVPAGFPQPPVTVPAPPPSPPTGIPDAPAALTTPELPTGLRQPVAQPVTGTAWATPVGSPGFPPGLPGISPGFGLAPGVPAESAWFDRAGLPETALQPGIPRVIPLQGGMLSGLASGVSAVPGAPSAPAASSTSETPAGLKAFIARIRDEDYRQAALLCPRQQSARTNRPQPGPRPLDIAAIRRDFPALNQSVHGKPLVWLDNAATTQKPQAVIDALADYYAHDNSNIHRAAHALAARSTDGYEGARRKIQTFLGASQPEEIVFVRGTTEGINLIANTYGRKHLEPGDEIILSQLEHHANIVPWQMLAREKGLTLRVIPVNDRGEVLLDAYQALLGPRTRLVSLTHASNSLGTILPVAEMTAMAKRVGAAVVIDGAQTVAHLAVNVQALNCDFYVFSGHKIFGPTGIGAVYGRRDMWNDLPPWQGGGNMIRNVTFEETTYSDPPARFEAGTPNIADAIGLGAALDYVQQFGLASIAAYEHELLQVATEALGRIPGLQLVGTAAEKVGVVSFVLKNQRVEDVGRQLDQEGIAVRAGHHCAQPSLRRFGLEATVRPSLSFYNTRGEIDYLADVVRRIARRTSP